MFLHVEHFSSSNFWVADKKSIYSDYFIHRDIRDVIYLQYEAYQEETLRDMSHLISLKKNSN